MNAVPVNTIVRRTIKMPIKVCYDCRWIGGFDDYCLLNDHQINPEESADDCLDYEVEK